MSFLFQGSYHFPMISHNKSFCVPGFPYEKKPMDLMESQSSKAPRVPVDFPPTRRVMKRCQERERSPMP